jgi:hypothetical protein
MKMQSDHLAEQPGLERSVETGEPSGLSSKLSESPATTRSRAVAQEGGKQIQGQLLILGAVLMLRPGD